MDSLLVRLVFDTTHDNFDVNCFPQCNKYEKLLELEKSSHSLLNKTAKHPMKRERYRVYFIFFK